ncbi:MAG: acyltransferase domain-containing protein, partial [Actinomycetota bacterium]|nr:acyltransferase domain-containing protein [Actinomycetota bacterium]
MIALLAPGQGAQSVGMLSPWLALDGAVDRVAVWSEVTGLDLHRLGTTAHAEEIKDTAVTQPLVVALSLLAAEALFRRVDLPPDAPVAGHSVGELTAAVVAGVLTADEAVALAAVRGREMAAACALEPTGMSAVLGGDAYDVAVVLAELGLDAANHNGAG